MTTTNFYRRSSERLRSDVDFRPYGLIGRLQAPQYRNTILGLAGVASILSLAAGAPFTALAIASVPGLIYPHLTSDLQLGFSRACARCGWNGSSVLGVLFGLTIGAAFFFGSAAPAHALFFRSAEQFMKTQVFAGVQGADTMIGLTINVLRAIFVIYVGIAVVSVVQKMQQGDDWQTASRIPLVVMLSAAVGDRMSEMIIGSGGGGGAAGGG